MRAKILTTGMVGTVIAAVCCFTPALVILFGAIGLSAVLAVSNKGSFTMSSRNESPLSSPLTSMASFTIRSFDAMMT